MNVTKRGVQLSTLAVAMMLAALHGRAGAAGFQLFVQNVSGLGNAYAGQAASAEDASTTFYNAAGLTNLKGGQFVFSSPFVKPETKFSDAGSCAPYAGTGVGTTTCPFGQGGNLGHAFGGDGGDAGKLAWVPGAYVSYEVLSDRMWLGFGASAPFGSRTEWNADWIGRFNAIESEIKTKNYNPTIAWKVNDIVSLGAGVNRQFLHAHLNNAVSYRAVALSTLSGPIVAGTPPGSEGVATVEGDDWGWGWDAGLRLRVAEATFLGISYRSRVAYRVVGNVSFSDRPAALGVVPQVADGSAAADIKLPDTLSLALSHQLTRDVQLLGDVTWTRWSSIQDLTVVRTSGPLSGQILTSTPLHLKNTWRAAAGANYQLSTGWKVRAGTAYDKAAAQDEFRTPRLPDSDRVWFALGAQWKTAAPNLAVDVGYAYVLIKDATSRLPNQDAPNSPPRGSLVGTYKASAQIIGLQIAYSF